MSVSHSCLECHDLFEDKKEEPKQAPLIKPSVVREGEWGVLAVYGPTANAVGLVLLSAFSKVPKTKFVTLV